MKKHLNYILLAIGLAVMLALGGCANTKITYEDNAAQTAHLAKPQAIYVGEFNTSSGTWNLEGDDKTDYATQVKGWLETGLVDRLNEIAPTKRYTGAETSGWLVTGETIHSDAGSSVGQAFAPGLGQRKISVRVHVYDLATSRTMPIASFISYADTGAQSGMYASAGQNTARACRAIRDELIKLTSK